MRQLATWVMDRIAKEGRSEWTLAMRREFDELDQGHLGWAVGCLLTEIRDRVWNEKAMLAAIVAIHFLGPALAAFASVPADRVGGFGLSQIVAFCYAAPWAFVLGVYWPRSTIMITMFGGVILPLFVGYSATIAILDMQWADYILVWEGAVILGGVNTKGSIAMILLWYGCSNLGARMSRKRLSVFAHSPSNP